MNTINKFTLYAYPFRSRAERVLWTLRECDLPYEVLRLDITKGETRAAFPQEMISRDMV